MLTQRSIQQQKWKYITRLVDSSSHDKTNTISTKLTKKRPATVEVIIVTSVRTTIPRANIRFRFRKGIRLEIICVRIRYVGDQVGELKIRSQKDRWRSSVWEDGEQSVVYMNMIMKAAWKDDDNYQVLCVSRSSTWQLRSLQTSHNL